MSDNNMRVLITGSRGFIGKNLVNHLKKLRHFVKEFDLELGNDLLKAGQVREAVKGVDAVIHLAAIIDESTSKKKLFEVNVKGTEILLEESAKAKVKKFIYLSTVGVMGEVSEKANELTPFNPKTNYEQSKAEAEKKVNEFQELIPIVVLRSALVLGPNKYWAEITKLIQKNFPIIGSGENTFQIVYFKDLINAIAFILSRREIENETFIVAEEKGKTLKEVYGLFQKELGLKGEIKTVSVLSAKMLALGKKIFGESKSLLKKEYIERLVRERNYDVSKLLGEGWKPFYPTDRAVKETVRELKEKKII
jgi:nucleoside-diphosphate-sugar epimerase